MTLFYKILTDERLVLILLKKHQFSYRKDVSYLSSLELNLKVLRRLLSDSPAKVQLVDLSGLIPQWLLVGHDVHKALAPQAAVLLLVGLATLNLVQLTGPCPQTPLGLPALLAVLALVQQFVAANEELRFTL